MRSNVFFTVSDFNFIDLNEFKKVNDTHGHDVGDSVLSESSKRIKSVLRDMDIACRVGGDEFLILLSEIEHTNDAVTFSIKLLDSLINPHYINNKKIF